MAKQAEFYDPQRALVEPWRDYFLERREDLFILPCIEGEVELNGAWMLLNIMLVMPLIKRHREISRDRHLMLAGIYDASEHAKRTSQISRTLEEFGYTREELGHDIISTVMDAHNMCYTHLGTFIGTMDIFSIADTILQDAVKPTVTMDYGDLTDGKIKRMERDFKQQCDVVDKLLSGDTLKTNVFRAPLVCGALKKGQFHQFVLSAGPRTDTDDHIFLRPVVGSFLSGMKDIKDLAIESRSAAKATYYNKTQMSNTQYKNRKIHIQNSVMWHLYPGDCGTSVYMTYTPNTKTVKHYVGKFFLNSSNELVELTPELFPEVINKTLKFRDVPACQFTDGYCEVCGGTITHSFYKTGNVGFLSNVKTGAPVAQQVLSTKHLISTDAAEYEIPDDLKDFFLSIMDDIFLKPQLRSKLSTLALGFQPRDVSKLNDLKYIINDGELHAAYYTDIKFLNFGSVGKDGEIEKISTRTSMGGDHKTYPHLSPEILTLIRNNPENMVVQNGVAWLLLKNVDIDVPIMQCTVINNSIKRFVEQFSTLVTRDIERYSSMNDLMHELTKVIWDRVDTHLTHISCLARACMITSRKDFNIPVMTDPDDVKFGTLGRIIPMRSVGGLLAFERYNLATNKPVTYITPKRHGIFDEFLGFTDIIARDMNFPVGAFNTNRAVEE